VRERRDPGGRMPYRIYFEDGEIDQIMEAELRRAHLPRIGDSAVDVDAFIETYLQITPEYVTLPRGVQGATDFFRDGTVAMRISAELSERAGLHEPGAENLIRTTLAHEAAHVLLHRSLFLTQSEALFGQQASRQELCRDIDPAGRGYTGEWWEWQANRGMGALLLPRSEIIAMDRCRTARWPARPDDCPPVRGQQHGRLLPPRADQRQHARSAPAAAGVLARAYEENSERQKGGKSAGGEPPVCRPGLSARPSCSSPVRDRPQETSSYGG